MDENQNKLNLLLIELAQTDGLLRKEQLSGYIERLHNIYSGNFRHLYSSLFSVITSVDDAPQRNLVTLTENIRILYSAVLDSTDEADEFSVKIKKLYDHINLDVARIEYTKRIADKINDENTITNKELKAVRAKADQMQKDYVTILGIFSSIVLTFVAGMVFSSSVLSNIDKVSIYRLTFVMLMIALLIFNLFNFLLKFIQKINQRGVEIAEQGKSIISSINVMIFLLMFINVICWLFYWYRMLY